MDSINEISYCLNKCQTLSNRSQLTFFFQVGSTLVHMHCACNSPTAMALSTSFLLNHVPQQPRAERIDCKIYGVVQQREYES